MKKNVHPRPAHWYCWFVGLMVFSMLAGLVLPPSSAYAQPNLEEASSQAINLANPIRISQIYGGGGNSGATYTHDFIELYNAGAAPVNVDGWSVQYASATGSTWQVTALGNKTIQPGSYFLIQQAAGTGGSTPLPAPDVVGTIPLAAGSGKVILAAQAAALSGACPAGPEIVDKVGFGVTSCFEGSGYAFGPSNTTAVVRKDQGCKDTDDNYADFDVAAPTPRNSSSPIHTCPPPVDLTLAMEGAPWRELGVEFVHTISIANQNIVPQVEGLAFTSSLPSGLTYLSDTSGITPTLTAPGVYTWSLGNLVDGDSVNFSITLVSESGVIDGASLVHQGSLTAAAAPGDNPANNSTSLTTRFYDGGTIVPILDVRTATSGLHTVEGYVTMKPGTVSAPEWVLQDLTGGIAVYDAAFIPSVSLGDFVRLRGTRGSFSNQEQLGSVVFVDKIDSGPEVEPLLVTTGQLASGSTEGWLVQVEGVVSGLGACSGNTTFFLNDGSGEGQIFVNTMTGVNVCQMGLENGLIARITGFSSQYNTAYQVKVRRPADVDLIYQAPQISKQAPARVSPGEVFTYTITVANQLGYDLNEIVVADVLPEYAEYRAGGSFNDGLVSWAIPSLPDNADIQLSLSVTATHSMGVWIVNEDYFVTASNYITPTVGSPVTTVVDDRLRIRHIQGAGSASPMVSQAVAGVTGIVTYIHQLGFFMQDPEPDIYDLTSEGIFVYHPSSTPDLPPVGSAVTIGGTVRESYNMTRLESASWTSSSTNEVIEPLVIALPVNTDLERYEGMLVTIPQTLTISQNYFQGQFGQLTLSSDGRMYNPNNGNDLGDTFELNRRRMIVLDDGTELSNVFPVPYLPEDFLLRAGDQLSGLTGVIDYGLINTFSSGLRHYRLHPVEEPVFLAVNHRPDQPGEVGGSLKIASFNVLNYFNGDGAGGGFPTSRGARSLEDFLRQRTKIIAAITALEADVIGLMEMENDGTGPLSALQDLVNGLNDLEGPGTYAFIQEPAPGTDEIKVSFIYRTSAVEPLSACSEFPG
jgi:uncharacterized repeat protein (TIGR01451 family)